MQIQDLKAKKGTRKKKRIVGRGPGSGRGKTSGRGENGQRSRTGRWTAKASEGGQSRLIRRLPKVGFNSHRPILNQIVSVGDLNKFKANDVVNQETLKEIGLINSLNKPFKILGDGQLKNALVVQVAQISKQACEKIEKAGGKVERIKAEPVIKGVKLGPKKAKTADSPEK